MYANLIEDKLWELDEQLREAREERDNLVDDYHAMRISYAEYEEYREMSRRAIQRIEFDRQMLIEARDA